MCEDCIIQTICFHNKVIIPYLSCKHCKFPIAFEADSKTCVTGAVVYITTNKINSNSMTVSNSTSSRGGSGDILT